MHGEHLGTSHARLRVLLVHNAYQQRGGEDVVVDAEERLLREHGCEVVRYERHNDEIAGGSKLGLLRDTIWSARTTRDAAELMGSFKPDVVHVHNSFPLVSPSIYWAAHRLRVPVVQTLHNFRLICPQGTMIREQAVCTDCVGHVPWRAVVHRCYRGSAAQSTALSAMLQTHRALGTWRDRVTLYVVLNSSCQHYFVKGGIPADKIRIKPNFTREPGVSPSEQRAGLLFVGRLSPEKGVEVLIDAKSRCANVPLRIVGDGPLAACLTGQSGVALNGPLPAPAVQAAMAGAIALVVPSVWPEMFGLVVIEAYAAGLPVIASRVGALGELVEDGLTGLLVRAGDPDDLAEKMLWAVANSDRMAVMGIAARQRYEQLYTPVANARALDAIYREAMQLRRAS